MLLKFKYKLIKPIQKYQGSSERSNEVLQYLTNISYEYYIYYDNESTIQHQVIHPVIHPNNTYITYSILQYDELEL